MYYHTASSTLLFEHGESPEGMPAFAFFSIQNYFPLFMLSLASVGKFKQAWTNSFDLFKSNSIGK